VLSWYENIPVLSYAILGGKCKKCKKPISFVYPLVELLTAGLITVLYLRYGWSFKTLIYFIFFASMIITSFIDFERQEIPDIITLPGIVIGLLLSVIYPDLMGKDRMGSFLDSLTGMLIGGGSLYAIGFLGEIVFKKEAMGGGDIKLLAMIGAFLGFHMTILTFYIAPFLGFIPALYSKLKKGQGAIAYGPYLSAASFAALLFGKDIINFYIKQIFGNTI